MCQPKKENKYLFPTEFTINGETYAGHIPADSMQDAAKNLAERKQTEHLIAYLPPMDYVDDHPNQFPE